MMLGDVVTLKLLLLKDFVITCCCLRMLLEIFFKGVVSEAYTDRLYLCTGHVRAAKGVGM